MWPAFEVLVAEAAYKLHANRQTRLRPGERPQKSISQETETRVAGTRFECVATSTSGRPLAQPCINPTHNRSLRLWCRPAQAKSESPPSSSSPRHEVAVVIGSEITVILGVSVSVIGIGNADAFRLLCSGGPLGTAASTSASDRAPVIRALLNHGLMVSVADHQPDPKMDQRATALRRPRL